MPYLILGLTLVLGVFLLGRWFVSAPPKEVFKVLKITAALITLVVVIVLALSGRLLWALAGLPALALWARRMFGAYQTAKSFAEPNRATGGGKSSEIETNYLRMQLDHTTGRMSGVVLSGAHRGQSLDMLSLDMLLDLLQTFRVGDLDSARIMESYLDRAHPDWRRGDAGKGTRSSAMDRSEAFQILDLDETASVNEIKAAHRRLMANLHPDHGGSSYLAAQINRAKDVLLGARG